MWLPGRSPRCAAQAWQDFGPAASKEAEVKLPRTAGLRVRSSSGWQHHLAAHTPQAAMGFPRVWLWGSIIISHSQMEKLKQAEIRLRAQDHPRSLWLHGDQTLSWPVLAQLPTTPPSFPNAFMYLYLSLRRVILAPVMKSTYGLQSSNCLCKG